MEGIFFLRYVPFTLPSSTPPSHSSCEPVHPDAEFTQGQASYRVQGNMIYKFASQDGALLWKHPLVTSSQSRLEVIGTVIYVFLNNDIYALQSDDGHEIWHRFFAKRLTYTTEPATFNVSKDLIHVMHLDGTLLSLDAHNGSLLWTNTSIRPHHFLLANKILYMKSEKDVLFALDAATGVEIWHYIEYHPQNDFTYSSSPSMCFAPQDNGVLYDTANSYLYAFEARTGHALWYQRISSSQSLGKPTVVDGMLYVQAKASNGDEEMYTIYAFSASQGHLLWQSNRGSDKDIIAVTDGSIILSGPNRSTLYALDIHDGHLRWQIKNCGSTGCVY